MGYKVIIYVDGNANYEDEIYSTERSAERAAEEAIEVMKWDPAWKDSYITYRVEKE